MNFIGLKNFTRKCFVMRLWKRLPTYLKRALFSHRWNCGRWGKRADYCNRHCIVGVEFFFLSPYNEGCSLWGRVHFPTCFSARVECSLFYIIELSLRKDLGPFSYKEGAWGFISSNTVFHEQLFIWIMNCDWGYFWLNITVFVPFF